MPSLEDVFRRVNPVLHFNIELKFPADDSVDISDADVAHMLDHVIPVSPPFALDSKWTRDCRIAPLPLLVPVYFPWLSSVLLLSSRAGTHVVPPASRW